MKITGNLITMFGVVSLIIYVIIKIFNFYGITSDYYGLYLVFYVFLIFCLFVFPTSYEK